MNIEEAMALAETQGYTVRNYGDVFYVTGEGLGAIWPEYAMGDFTGSAYEDTLEFNLDQFSDFVSELSGGEAVTPEGLPGGGNGELGDGNGQLEGAPPGWPADRTWPPPIYEDVYHPETGEVTGRRAIPGSVDYIAYTTILREARLREEFEEGRAQRQEEAGQRYSTYSSAVAAARAATEASRDRGHMGMPGPIRQEYEVVGIPGDYRIQAVEPVEPVEQFLGTVTEGGWDIDQHGYIDPITGEERITRRQSRQSIKDPILSLDDMIADALGKVDDWSAAEGTEDYLNLQRAQRLFDFKNQPTDEDRLRLAMDIAQSPSDYMTLVGLYTGAVSSAGVGGKVAPLMPYLQQMAQKFFLDIPGINEMLPPEVPEPDIVDVSPVPTVSPELDIEEFGALQGGEFEGSIVTPSGRLYNPTTGVWEDVDAFEQRTGQDVLRYQDPSREIPPLRTPTEEEELGVPTYTGNRFVVPKTLPVSQEMYSEAMGQLTDALPGTVYRPYESAVAIDIPEEISSQMPTPFDAEGASRLEAGLPYRQGRWTGGTMAEWNAMSQAERDAIRGGAEWAEGTTFVPTAEWRPDVDPYSAPITAPTSIRDGSSSSRTDGSEMVIPNDVRSTYTESLFGPTFTPRRETLGKFLTRPGTKGQIPSMPAVQAAQFRFRSPQTIRNMTPLQRSLFQASMQPMFGIPYEDWRMQERLATDVGGTGRPSIKFRRPSFVRG